MSKVYSKSELQEILDLYANQSSRNDAIARADKLLKDFVKEDADVEETKSALEVFNKIIETFGTTVNNAGDRVLTQLGAQASARSQAIIDSLENAENLVDPNRIFSLTSDQNQIKFDLVSLKVYKEMGLVDSSINPANMTPGQLAEKIMEVSTSLTTKEREEYASKFIDNIIGNQELFEITPPRILADAYTFTKQQLSKNKKDTDLKKRFAVLSGKIDTLIKDFAKQVGRYYSDPSNIADVYAGYRKMCDVRGKDLKIERSDNKNTMKYKKELKKSIDQTMARLEEIVALYSEMWNLKDLKPEDASKLDARWKEISDSLKDVKLTNNVLATLAKYEFFDENGNPMPQFIDDQGKEQKDFKPGYKLNPTGRLNRIISLAKNDVTMRNVGDLAHDVKDIDLTKALFDRVPWKMAEISIPNQVISGIESKPAIMMTQQDVNAFWDKLEKDGGNISDGGYQAAMHAQVNQAAGFAGMMAQKVGADKAIVMRPFEAIQAIDKLASTRSEKAGAIERKQKVGFFKRMAKNFGAAALMSAGLTFIGKATGVAYAGAAIGTVLGIGNMVFQGFKWRKQQKEAGKPYGLKAFLSDKRNWGPAVASGLGVAAVISMATGNPELAAGFGIGAMAVGGGSAAKMVYDDALAAGYTKGQALAGAIGVAGATIAGGLVGRAAMNGLISYVDNNTESNLFKTEHTTTSEHQTGTNRVYNDGVIQHHEDMMLKENWETPQSLETRIDGLMNAGLSHDDAMRYLLAWHDATDHNLGAGYFNNIGMSPEALAALRGSIDGTAIHLTPESIAAFEHFNPHISATNTVGYVPGTPVDYNLSANAAYDSNGVLIPGRDVYSTYVEHGNQVFSDVPVITTEPESIFTPNELAFPAGIGTVGIYEPRVIPDQYLDRMRERAGALADRSKKIVPSSDENDNGGNNQDGGKPSAEDIPPVNNPSGDEEETQPTDTKRGFFGKCKDLTYKFMRSVYHGLLKIQKGVHKMKAEKEAFEQEQAMKRAGFIKALHKEYEGLSIDDINEASLKDAAVLAGLNNRLKKRLGEKRLKLVAELDLADVKQKHEIRKRLRALDALAEEAERYDPEDAKAVEKLRKFENKLKVIEEEGKIDVEKKRVQGEIEIAEGKNKVSAIKGEGVIKKLRDTGQAFVSLFKGAAATHKADIEAAGNAIELAQKQFAKAKTVGAKKAWEEGIKTLKKLLKTHKYTPEQMQKITEQILQETLRQADNAK